MVCELNIWFNNFVEVQKKHRNIVEKKKGLLAAIESDFSAEEKGMKKDEIRKKWHDKTKKSFQPSRK